ncbi:MAG: hypothetical protein J7M21_02235 [Planctomycetes bacterium]|nr:hypothetical protein [Planctomycetota bacterium]
MKMHRNIYARAASAVVALLAAAAQSPAGERTGAIRPYAKNPYYWQYKGRPVLLLGGSSQDNLFQVPDLIEQLDALAACGGNYVRCVMSSRDEGDVWPFARRAGGKYDLDRWNEEYWRRFETFLAETAKRGIIVQIEIWATFDYYRDNWLRNPFNPRNNVNYTAAASGLPLEVPSHPTRARNDFFRSVPAAKDLRVVRAYQERFVEKILSYSLRCDHVLYTMDNETSVTPKWGAYWAEFIRRRARKVGLDAQTTEMWDKWDINHKMHDATFDHPEIYTFVDVSQNNHNKGQLHYDNILKRRAYVARRPRPMNNVKIYGADTGKYGSTREGIERFWRNIFAGCASARFHRPPSGLGIGDRARAMIKAARQVTAAIDVFSSRPRNDLLRERRANEAYCLACPGRGRYGVYFPAGGQVVLRLDGPARPAVLRWYDIDKCAWRAARDLPSGRSVVLRAPGEGPWAAVLAPQR